MPLNEKAGLTRRKKRQRQLIRAFVSGIAVGGTAVFAVFLIIALTGTNTNTGEIQAVFSPSFSVDGREDAAKEQTAQNDFLILVNWDNPVPYDRPDGLVTLYDIFSGEVILVNGEGSINETAGYAAKQMFADAVSEGIGMYRLTGAYRSVIYQDKLWEEKKEENPEYGNDPYTTPVKVMPGNMSEHATGLAIDILSENYDTADAGYGETKEGIWLAENAHEYGFILRYPEDKEHITGVIYEPWHFRYVGTEAAAEMHERGLCLEEYLNAYP